MFHRNRSRYLQIDLVGQSITRPMQKQKKTNGRTTRERRSDFEHFGAHLLWPLVHHLAAVDLAP